MARVLCIGAFLLLGWGCDGATGDGSCAAGEAECLSLYEIRYCVDGSWGEGEECPPVTSGDFEVTTVCDDGLCRP